MGISVLQYSDWRWKTPRGVATRFAQADEYRNSGKYNISGFGYVPFNEDTLDLHFLPGGFFNSPSFGPAAGHAAELNRDELEELIRYAAVVVLVEDDDQDQLSAGVQIEREIARGQQVRKINVRIIRAFNEMRAASLFSFADTDREETSQREPAASNNWTNRLTLWIEKNDSPEMFEESSIGVATLAIAIACFDRDEPDVRHREADWGARINDRDRLRRHAPIRPVPAVVVAPPLLAHVCETFPRLLLDDSFYIRRMAMLSVLAANSSRLIAAAANSAAAKVTAMSKHEDRRKLQDLAGFMYQTKALGWDEVVAAIRRNCGIEISLEDAGDT